MIIFRVQNLIYFCSFKITMQIIQSYWSCNRTDLLSNQPGWLAPEYNMMGWALSCLQLKKIYKNVVLYADRNTAKILIEDLKLPYDNVICELDNLNSYHPDLWALPKVYVYSKQNEPFLHVDGDVFIWSSFAGLTDSGLIAQNLESATIYYESIMKNLEQYLNFFPDEILKERDSGNPILAYNAGIFGGNDLDFFKMYADKAFQFVDKNKSSLPNIKVSSFNIFFEQYLFYCLTKKHKKNVDVLFKQVIGDNEYKGFGDFIEVPHNKQYLHILGNYKKNEIVCLQLANRLRLDYPEYYYRIISLYKKSGISLLHDYYHSLKDCDEQSLVSRQIILKEKYKNKALSLKSDTFYPKSQPEYKQLIGLTPAMNKDLNEFINVVFKIKNKKFRSLSIEYLYGRDLNISHYFEYLFAYPESLYSKELIADENFEIITSKFDWSKINMPDFAVEKVLNHSGKLFTVIIPECDLTGYSLGDIDSFDIEILKILKTKQSIEKLLDLCKRFFDTEDLHKSQPEYEKLILGRIKKGIHQKTIRVIKNEIRP